MSSLWWLAMRWKHICFCHWRVPAGLLTAYAPPGWQIDLFHDEAWISVVPFALEDVRLRGLPASPGFRYVPELNLRTYLRRGDVRAVYFFSLDAHSALLVEAARLSTGLPYLRARMQLEKFQGSASYRSERVDRRAAAGRFAADYHHSGVASRAMPGSLDEFLHERYHFVSKHGLIGRVLHEPYQLKTASVNISENTLGDVIGYQIPAQPDHARYAELLHVRSSYGI